MRLLQPGARCDEHLHARQVISGNQHTWSSWRAIERASRTRGNIFASIGSSGRPSGMPSSWHSRRYLWGTRERGRRRGEHSHAVGVPLVAPL